MNPYLAIIKDSFREAFASRVLPFLLILFTGVLALLAPLGFQEETSAEGRTGLKLTYAGTNDWPVLDQLPQLITDDPKTVRNTAESFLAWICMYLLGKAGVFVAILVSAAVIPRMMEPGSIDLLLSKPVSRTALFLTKFASGCAFILINVAYFMIGLWLIAGFRLGIWSGKLLLTIPVFLFVFSIVYSFSAVAGVLWRNPIVSVMFAIMAWLFCMGIGQFHDWMRLARSLESAAVIISAEDDLLITERSGATLRWNASTGDWDEVFHEAPMFRASLSVLGPAAAPLATPLLGPVYDPVHGKIAAGQMSFPTMTGGQTPTAIAVGTRESDWWAELGLSPPVGTTALFFDRSGNLMAVGPAGAFRSRGSPTGEGSGFDAARPARGGFDRVAPQDGNWSEPFAAALRRSDDALVVYDAGTLRVYGLADGRFALLRERDLGTKQAALVGAGEKMLLVVTADGKGHAFDAGTLEPAGEFSVGDPQSIVVSPDGQWIAVVSHRGRLWMYDVKNGREVSRGVSGQGDVTAAGFDEENRLLVADRVNRVTRYALDGFRKEAQFAPPEGGWGLTYRWLIVPLYTLLPKPGDLDLTVQYLFTNERVEALPGARQNLNARRIVHDVWTPVWSNLAVLAVILGLTSWHISRRDF